jgi:hypothetical protein
MFYLFFVLATTILPRPPQQQQQRPQRINDHTPATSINLQATQGVKMAMAASDAAAAAAAARDATRLEPRVCFFTLFTFY